MRLVKEPPARLHFHYEGLNGERWVQYANLPPSFKTGTKGAKRKAKVLIYQEVRRETRSKRPPETVYVVLQVAEGYRTILPKTDVRSLFT